MKEFDTIAAISTAMGEGGIAIVRVSGENAKKIVNNIFEAKNGKPLIDMKTYTMRYGFITDVYKRQISKLSFSLSFKLWFC